MQIGFNQDAIESIKILNSYGYEAYIVGGAIRDYFLDIKIHDYDLVTSASLDKVLDIFKDYKTKIYSHKKCVSIKFNDTRLEYSSLEGLSIIDNLNDRDFKMNSIAYSPKTGFIDPQNGITDLKNNYLSSYKIDEKIKRDPLRILRGIRFLATKDLTIDSSVSESFNKYAYLLDTVHPMRIEAELTPILLSKKPSIYLDRYKDVFKVLFPELSLCIGFNQHSPWHSYDVYTHTLKVVDSTMPNIVSRLTALFHDIKKPETFMLGKDGRGHFPEHYIKSSIYAKEMLLKYSYNKMIVKRVEKLVLYHDTRLKCNRRSILSFLVDFGVNDLDLFFDIQKADIMGQNPDLIDRLEENKKLKEFTFNIVENEKIISYKKLMLKENDLINLGYDEMDIKVILIELAIMVINGEVKNSKKDLLNKIREIEIE